MEDFTLQLSTQSKIAPVGKSGSALDLKAGIVVGINAGSDFKVVTLKSDVKIQSRMTICWVRGDISSCPRTRPDVYITPYASSCTLF